MCEVKIYLNKKDEKTKLIDGISEYQLNLGDKKLIAYQTFGGTKEFKFRNLWGIRWSELDDSLIIQGELESIAEN